MKIRDARSIPSAAQEDIRRRAVNAVLEGKTQIEIAKIFGVTRQAVGKWMKAFREGRTKALQAKPKGRPEGGSLKLRQVTQIVKIVVERCPDQVKLPFYLWTREAVAQLIERKFGIRLSIWTIGRYLARWGFTPQKPVHRAFEQNPKQVDYWLKKEYPTICKKAKSEKAEIYWGDEMGLHSDHASGRSYGRRGKTPVIPCTGQRFGCNMISAITNRGRLNFMVFKERFRVNIFLNFLNRLVRQTKRKVFLIVDRHPVHRSHKVKTWLKKNAHYVHLFYLPGYSPELNPDEMLNQDVKNNAVGSQRARNQEELIIKIRGYLRKRQRQPDIVKKYFKAKTVQYAA